MADRRPLIINASAQQIQELPTNDGLIGNGTFPLGGIIMWSGAISAIPTGWSLCDGSNGTPDLRNRFVLGATNDGSDSTYPGISVSQTGGTADAVVVSHNHGITDPGHEHTFSSNDSDGGTGNESENTMRIQWYAVPSMNAYGTGTWDMTGGSDPWYMKRVVDYILANNAHLIFDADRSYPLGGVNPRPPLFTWSIALVSMLLEPMLGEDAVWYAILGLPAIYGALTIFPIACLITV
jgi:hypothetical protein